MACSSLKQTFSVLGILQIYYAAVSLAAVHVSCPVVLYPSKVNDIVCKIDTNETSASNCQSAESVTFLWKPLGSGLFSPLAECPFPPPTACAATLAENTCGCTSISDGKYVYTFRFRPTLQHGRGRITADVCVPKNGQDEVTCDKSCLTLEIEEFQSAMHLMCPPYFSTTRPNHLTVRINIPRLFAAKCYDQSKVLFKYVQHHPHHYTRVLGECPYPVSPSDNCSLPLAIDQCRCTGKDDNDVLYTFSWLAANKTLDAGAITACLCENPAAAASWDMTVTESCNHLNFGRPKIGQQAGATNPFRSWELGLVLPLCLLTRLLYEEGL